MNEVDLRAGDIFTWQNYPYFFKEAKPQRWVLYLGNNTIEAIVYHISATTQYQYYDKDGIRKNNNFFELPAGMGGLEEKSILDLSFFMPIPEADLNKCKSDINKKGSLSQDYISRFAKYLKNDRHIQTIVKKDIFHYLQDAGFKITWN